MKITNLVAAITIALASSTAIAGPVYRCQQEGRTVFSDQPCESGINRGGSGPRADGSNPRAAASGQVPREHVQFAGDVAALRTAQLQDAGRQGRCRDLHDEVKYIDGQARQPNAPSYLEYLKDRRRNITDRIASLKCDSL